MDENWRGMSAVYVFIGSWIETMSYGLCSHCAKKFLDSIVSVSWPSCCLQSLC